MNITKSKLTIWVIIAALAIIQLAGIILAIPRYESKKTTIQAKAQTSNEFVKGRVTEVKNTNDPDGGLKQELSILALDGSDAGKTIQVVYNLSSISTESRKLSENEQLLLTKNTAQSGKEATYTVLEKYRLDTLLFVTILFVLIVFAVGGWRGIGALASLALSILVILFGTIPMLSAGVNILLVTLVTATVICVISIFLSHGFGLRTRYALVASLFTLLTAINLSVWLVEAAKLTGLAGEASQYLQFSSFGSLNFVGVIIASIVIASIGVLDDVTTSQAAVVDELQKANPSLTVWELFSRSMSVGREHIASMVNSLVLVYIGTSFATFLVLFGGKLYPLGVTLNLETITQEIISSLVVSMCLTLAVPITSFITAIFIKKGSIGVPKIALPSFLLTKK
jgi:uncharacterized membrane protein